jgi:hypothetical protein
VVRTVFAQCPPYVETFSPSNTRHNVRLIHHHLPGTVSYLTESNALSQTTISHAKSSTLVDSQAFQFAFNLVHVTDYQSCKYLSRGLLLPQKLSATLVKDPAAVAAVVSVCSRSRSVSVSICRRLNSGVTGHSRPSQSEVSQVGALGLELFQIPIFSDNCPSDHGR